MDEQPQRIRFLEREKTSANPPGPPPPRLNSSLCYVPPAEFGPTTRLSTERRNLHSSVREPGALHEQSNGRGNQQISQPEKRHESSRASGRDHKSPTVAFPARTRVWIGPISFSVEQTGQEPSWCVSFVSVLVVTH